LALPLALSQVIVLPSVLVPVVVLVSGSVVVPSLLLVSVVAVGHVIKASVNPEMTAEFTKTSPPSSESIFLHVSAAVHSMTSPVTAALR